MSMENEAKLIDVMADSLGLTPFRGEDESAFIIRCIYSASRFWIEGFCLDDGAGGSEGIRKQLITRRLSKWLTAMSDIYPDAQVPKRFKMEERTSGFSTIYDKLIMVGDIVSENQGATYRCAQTHMVPYAKDASAVIGLCDISDQEIRKHTILSGLMVSTQASDSSQISFDEEKYAIHWWDVPDAYRTWIPVSDLSRFEYFNPMATKWKLSASSSWQSDFPRYGEYALGRENRQFGPEYYIVRSMRSRAYASKITTEEAWSFSLHVRALANHPLKVTISILDKRYAKVVAPFWLLPPEISRWVDLMTWPEEDAADNLHRIIRQELITQLIPMLRAADLHVED